MKKYLLILFVLINFSLLAQNTGDYRSNPVDNSGNWNQKSWDIFIFFWWFNINGSPSTSNTNQNTAITILDNDTITVTDTRSVYNLSIEPDGVLEINKGSSLTVLTDLDIHGVVINNGTLILNQFIKLKGHYSGDGDVIFMGTSHQTIDSLDCNNLTISNSAGTSINGNVNIKGKLTLANGNLFLNSGTLTFGDTASVSGQFNSSKMIVASDSGHIRKMFSGTGSFTFPIGDSTGAYDYSPAKIKFTSGSFSNGIVTVNVNDQKHPNNSSTNDYITRYWTITQTGISNFSAEVTFKYVNADIVGNEASVYTGQYHNSNWTLLKAANPSLNQLGGTVSTFSDFTGGEQGAYPVELSSFTASVKDDEVILNWETATEINNFGFDVERSPSPTPSQREGAFQNNWQKIDFVKGYGNSNSPKQYSYTDKTVSGGNYFYRLKQIDLDGSSDYSEIVQVKIKLPDNFTLDQNFPNPFNPSTTIKYTLPKSAKVKLIIYNSIGIQVAMLVDGEQSEGKHNIEWNAENFSSGVYYYQLQAGDFIQIRKMILLK